MMTDVILINLLKAFDIIDHGLVLQKLYIIGFSNYTVNWFKSDLSSKSFLVNFIFSQPASLSCIAPQGSILDHSCFQYIPMKCHKLEHKDINKYEN